MARGMLRLRATLDERELLVYYTQTDDDPSQPSNC